MVSVTESHVEEAALIWLSELGYSVTGGLEIGPDGSKPERENYGEVFLLRRVRAAIERLNPSLAPEVRETVLTKILQSETPSLVQENRRLHRYLIEGVPVEVRRTRPTDSAVIPTTVRGGAATTSAAVSDVKRVIA
jgi:type I restriction enzyme R subunit